jgi:ATP-dependent Clp protease ATP-binding subunit ClpA
MTPLQAMLLIGPTGSGKTPLAFQLGTVPICAKIAGLNANEWQER